MSSLGVARADPACCAVRGGVVVLGGEAEVNEEEVEMISTVEVSRLSDSEAEALPPLSCGPRTGSIALPIDESESAEGQVLLLGGFDESLHQDGEPLDEASRVVKVDLATGACTPHAN
jgi:hypothetical protein